MRIGGLWAQDLQTVMDTDDEKGFLREYSGFRNRIARDGNPGRVARRILPLNRAVVISTPH